MSQQEIKRTIEHVNTHVAGINYSTLASNIANIVTAIVEFVYNTLGETEPAAVTKALSLIEAFLASYNYRLSRSERDMVVGMVRNLREVALGKTKIGEPPIYVGWTPTTSSAPETPSSTSSAATTPNTDTPKKKKKKFSIAKLFRPKPKPAA